MRRLSEALEAHEEYEEYGYRWAGGLYDQEAEWKEQVSAVKAAYRVVKAENIEREREEQERERP